MTKMKTIFASSPTQAGISKAIQKFYGGEEKEVRPIATCSGSFEIYSKTTGKKIPEVSVDLRRGRYVFGIATD